MNTTKKHLFHLLCWLFLSGLPKCFPSALKISPRLLFLFTFFIFFLLFYIIIWWALNFRNTRLWLILHPIFLLITTQTFFTDVVLPLFFTSQENAKKISHWFWIMFFDTNELWPVIRKEKKLQKFSFQHTKNNRHAKINCCTSIFNN